MQAYDCDKFINIIHDLVYQANESAQNQSKVNKRIQTALFYLHKDIGPLHNRLMTVLIVFTYTT